MLRLSLGNNVNDQSSNLPGLYFPCAHCRLEDQQPTTPSKSIFCSQQLTQSRIYISYNNRPFHRSSLRHSVHSWWQPHIFLPHYSQYLYNALAVHQPNKFKVNIFSWPLRGPSVELKLNTGVRSACNSFKKQGLEKPNAKQCYDKWAEHNSCHCWG